jgi:predicted nucleotidyltransferase
MVCNTSALYVVVFHIGDEPERIDFLSKVQGLNFEKAFKDRRYLAIQGKEVPFLNLDDLIVSKLLADRLKDKADIEELQKIAALRNKDK